jgi:uncharacterized protein (TIGR02466 family)
MQNIETRLRADELVGEASLADLARNGQVENIFPTPIFWHVIKDCAALNADLREVILARERSTPSASKSNMGGWQSGPDLFTWEESAIAALARYIRAAVDIATVRVTAPAFFRGQYDLFGWGAINRKGHYNAVHLHPMGTWSGVYYVDPGDDEGSDPGGRLEFAHPVPAAAMSFFPSVLPSARLVKPEAGMIILFPSYLYHSVRMYEGSRPRICVPFNAHLKNGAG